MASLGDTFCDDSSQYSSSNKPQNVHAARPRDAGIAVAATTSPAVRFDDLLYDSDEDGHDEEGSPSL